MNYNKTHYHKGSLGKGLIHMSKFIITCIIVIFSSQLLAEETKWFETTKDSHIFIKQHATITDKNNPDLKTVIMAVNIPSFQERKADPTKTLFTNASPISYLSEITINCKDKTSKTGKQTLHEEYFGKGKIIEQQDANIEEPFQPMSDNIDAKAIWEIACTVK